MTGAYEKPIAATAYCARSGDGVSGSASCHE